jgi:Family of unknown function (DUF6600)
MNHSRQFLSNFLLALILSGTALLIPSCATMTHGTYHEPYPTDSFESLDFYGEWFVSHQFGRVWRPYAVAEWRPFYYGNWVWTEFGWTWVAYEPFGWMVYHYGYWYHDPFREWCWIPGNRWSPANVVWLHADIYIGWAPMPPPGIFIDDPWQTGHEVYWRFVDVPSFQKERINRYVLPRLPPKQKTIINRPPDLDFVERLTGTKIRVLPTRPVEIGKDHLQKIQLPSPDERKVDRHRSEVEKKILKPKQKLVMPEKKPNK